uniref:Putative kek6 n=1 Tax=Corethrella appendiculata TaxID=1370023 RepID=U5ED75_9DIPT
MAEKIFLIFSLVILRAVGEFHSNINSDELYVNHQVCPKICICDIIDGFKRADCSGENLINTYTDVPDSVEILDLSNNRISVLDNKCLRDYKNVIKLFLSENEIQTIFLDAFIEMKFLKYLDLSENRLEYIDDKIFEENSELIEVNLSQNKFMNIQDRPFLQSDSLMFLDLNDAHIPHIYVSMFEKLPHLRTLDLSENLLITFDTNAVKHLKNLEYINLEFNRWKCENSMKDVVKWFKAHGIKVEIEKCLLSPLKHTQMFERMELFPSYNPEKESREDVDISELWGNNGTKKEVDKKTGVGHDEYWTYILEKTCSKETASNKICDDFLMCQHKYHELYHLYTKKGNQVKTLYPVRSIGYIFYAGMLVGLIAGTVLTYLVCICKKQWKIVRNRNKIRQQIQERNRFRHSRLMDSPRPQHREIITPTTRQEPPIRHQNENSHQFLVNLFGKRQPRYLRNMHHLTMRPNSIANNSEAVHESSQPPTQYETENLRNAEIERLLALNSQASSATYLNFSQPNLSHIEPVQPQPTCPNDPEYAQLSLILPERNLTNLHSVSAENLQENDQVFLRGESPPPTYTDCIIRLNSQNSQNSQK